MPWDAAAAAAAHGWLLNPETEETKSIAFILSFVSASPQDGQRELKSIRFSSSFFLRFAEEYIVFSTGRRNNHGRISSELASASGSTRIIFALVVLFGESRAGAAGWGRGGGGGELLSGCLRPLLCARQVRRDTHLTCFQDSM